MSNPNKAVRAARRTDARMFNNSTAGRDRCGHRREPKQLAWGERAVRLTSLPMTGTCRVVSVATPVTRAGSTETGAIASLAGRSSAGNQPAALRSPAPPDRSDITTHAIMIAVSTVDPPLWWSWLSWPTTLLTAAVGSCVYLFFVSSGLERRRRSCVAAAGALLAAAAALPFLVGASTICADGASIRADVWVPFASGVLWFIGLGALSALAGVPALKASVTSVLVLVLAALGVLVSRSWLSTQSLSIAMERMAHCGCTPESVLRFPPPSLLQRVVLDVLLGRDEGLAQGGTRPRTGLRRMCRYHFGSVRGGPSRNDDVGRYSLGLGSTTQTATRRGIVGR